MATNQGVIAAPNACRWCAVDQRDHVQLWTTGVGWHGWTEPTTEQRKTRMELRRDAAAEAMWAHNEGIDP